MNRVLECYEKEKNLKELYEYIKKNSVDPSYEIEQALVMCIYASANNLNFIEMYNKIINDTGRPNEVLKILYDQHRFGFRTKNDEDKIVNSFISDVQMAFLPNEWRKYKQTYEFDRDFIVSLANTDTTFTLLDNAFDFLPFDNFYMDFSDNKEICEEMGIDGTLVKVSPVFEGDEKNFFISTINYLNGQVVYCFDQIAAVGKNDLTIENFLNRFSELEKTLSVYNVKNARLLLTLQIQSILYLASYQPEFIYEQKSSVAQRVNSKKNNKRELPETTYSVGEYYGIKYREYIKKQLEENKNGTSTGRTVRPHPVRGHFQHYHVNDPINGGKMTVSKFKLQYYSGLKKNEVDTKLGRAKHKVVREDLKNNEKMMKNKKFEKRVIKINR